MGIQYEFYIALKDKETGKIEYFPGMTYKADAETYDEVQEGKPTITRPRSIHWRGGSEMPDGFKNEFEHVDESDCTDEVKEAFTYEGWYTNKKTFSTQLYRMTVDILNELSDDFIKRGYFLAEDVEMYEKNKGSVYDLDIFYDTVSETVYANMCTKQIKTQQVKDDEGYEYTKHGYEDYMYYAYPDYASQEYLVHVLKILANSYQEMIEFKKEFKGKELILLMEIC